MRFAATLIALLAMGGGIVLLISPESVIAVGRYFSTPLSLYLAGAVRIAVGIVLILSAPASRAPKTLRVFGAAVCVLGFATMFFGVERTQAIVEWEAMHTALLRAGAAVALAFGAFSAFAVTPVRRP